MIWWITGAGVWLGLGLIQLAITCRRYGSVHKQCETFFEVVFVIVVLVLFWPYSLYEEIKDRRAERRAKREVERAAEEDEKHYLNFIAHTSSGPQHVRAKTVHEVRSQFTPAPFRIERQVGPNNWVTDYP